ncbi:protein takeout-like [Lycorma delicatula]|uniref:protein takeout-like n=1 Tax=Lycorma delicatula TaxID=130591 RepID=UPI003F514033
MLMQQNTVFYISVIVISTVLAGINAAKLPNYISPCKRNDPELDKCIVDHGQKAIPRFALGDTKLGIPSLDPMDITELKVDQGNKQIGLSLTLKNIKLYGLKNAKFVKSNTDLKKRIAIYEIFHKRIELLGNYVVDGKILVLPIKGEGKCNITITDVNIVMDQRWDIVKKNGKDYLSVTKYEIKMTNGQAFFKLENLFNGDKTLGDSMNAFLNENWKEVTNDVAPAITKGLEEVFAQVTKNVLNSIPYDSVFPV